MEIRWHDAGPFSSAERALAEARVRELDREADDLACVRIGARLSLHHRQRPYEVAIESDAAPNDTAVSRAAADARTALFDALDAFEWRVRRKRDRDRDERHRAAQGVIDRVFADDGYGLIVTDGGEVVTFHRSALRGGIRLEALDAGQRVRLDLEGGADGSHATRVALAPAA